LAFFGGLFNNEEGVFTMGKYLEKSGLLGSSCLSLTARSVRSCFPHSILASQRGFGPADGRPAPHGVITFFVDVNNDGLTWFNHQNLGFNMVYTS
jgi:hypothetical protein